MVAYLSSCTTVRGLADIHAAGVIHKDLNPSNIIVNTNSGALNIIDFGIASYRQSSIEESPAVAPRFLQGTLQYIAPEQTGRMNRRIDYRTDFYALGIHTLTSALIRFSFDLLSS